MGDGARHVRSHDGAAAWMIAAYFDVQTFNEEARETVATVSASRERAYCDAAPRISPWPSGNRPGSVIGSLPPIAISPAIAFTADCSA